MQAAGLEGALRQREAEARGLREDLERAQGQHREEVAALRQEAEANEESLAEAQVSLALWLAGGFFACCCLTGACCFSIRQCSRVACRHAETLRHGVGLPCQHCAPALGLPLSAKLQGGDWSSRKCITIAVHPPLTCHSAAAHTQHIVRRPPLPDRPACPHSQAAAKLLMAATIEKTKEKELALAKCTTTITHPPSRLIILALLPCARRPPPSC